MRSAWEGRLAKVPHSVTAEVIEVVEPAMGGTTLEAMRERLGGEEGHVQVPGRDEQVLVSIRPWLDAAPEKRFALSFRVTPERPIRIRRPAAEVLIGALAIRAADAATVEELLDRPVQSWTGTKQPDGSYEQTPLTYTPREELARRLQPASRATLVRGLSDLVRRGDVARIGRGTRGDPYRYWMDPFRQG